MLPKGTKGVGGQGVSLWVQRRLEKPTDLPLRTDHSSLQGLALKQKLQGGHGAKSYDA